MNKQKFYSNCENTYKFIRETMGELQPISFLMSATLVFAGIFTKESSTQLYGNPAFIASYCFIFTYINLFVYKITKSSLFLIVGIFSGLIGFFNIFLVSRGLEIISQPFNLIVATNSFNTIDFNFNVFQNNQSALFNEIIYLALPVLLIFSFLEYARKLPKKLNRILILIFMLILTLNLASQDILYLLFFCVSFIASKFNIENPMRLYNSCFLLITIIILSVFLRKFSTIDYENISQKLISDSTKTNNKNIDKTQEYSSDDQIES